MTFEGISSVLEDFQLLICTYHLLHEPLLCKAYCNFLFCYSLELVVHITRVAVSQLLLIGSNITNVLIT